MARPPIAGTVVWVILPTFNEAPNLARMVREITTRLEPCGVDLTILVVDDNSPDGTGLIAARESERDGRVQLLRRPGRGGIGPAYRAGFERALVEGAELVVEMDCDFSHPPASLPTLLGAARDADLVIGSRYVRGGAIRRWGALRRIVSRAGCLYARWGLGVPVRDLTSGFKCFRREVLETIPLEDVASRGYGFQVEMTYRAIRAGFRVTEIPITFTERETGESKMGPGIVWEAALLVPALRFGRMRTRSRH